MRDVLKSALEKLAEETVGKLEKGQRKKARIILFNSDKSLRGGDELEVLSYVDNCLLNQGFVLSSRKIKAVVMPEYSSKNNKRYVKPGDVPVDVGIYLRKEGLI